MSTFPDQFRLDGRTALVTGSGRGLGWEMAQGLAGVRQEIAISRVESIRWSFIFWVGQVIATIGILATLLRSVKP